MATAKTKMGQLWSDRGFLELIAKLAKTAPAAGGVRPQPPLLQSSVQGDEAAKAPAPPTAKPSHANIPDNRAVAFGDKPRAPLVKTIRMSAAAGPDDPEPPSSGGGLGDGADESDPTLTKGDLNRELEAQKDQLRQLVERGGAVVRRNLPEGTDPGDAAWANPDETRRTLEHIRDNPGIYGEESAGEAGDVLTQIQDEDRQIR